MKASRIILGMVVAVLAVASFVGPVFAVTYGGGSPHGYASDTPLDYGTIVALDAKDGTKVQVATQKNLVNMYGVVVDPAQLLISSSSGVPNEAFVASSGTYDVLVSTQNGAIVKGDYITMSSIDGIAMKSTTEDKTVFGRAVTEFDGKGVTLGTSQIKDTSGNVIQTVQLGSVAATVNVQDNPDVISTELDAPEWLQRLGEQIAEKEVSAIRIYISMGITAASIITALVMLGVGIRNAVIAVGRNPLSKKSIFWALIQIILTSVVILIIGLFAVYLLLKL